MRIVAAGASGLIGSALVPALRADGHEVVRLVRRPAAAADEREWNPYGAPDPALFEGADGVVQLSGAGVADRLWTTGRKYVLRESRVTVTDMLARSLAALPEPPGVLVLSSAIGWYGDTGDRPVDEDAPAADTFLGHLCRDWEGAADPARAAGVRVVTARTGILLSARGGMLGKLLPAARFGLMPRFGWSGRQYVSFIAMADEIGALRWALTADVEGPVNLTAPHPVTNAEFTRAIGAMLGRPAFLRVPAFAFRALGGLGAEAVASQRVLPAKLQRLGYEFTAPDIASALTSALSSP